VAGCFTRGEIASKTDLKTGIQSVMAFSGLAGPSKKIAKVLQKQLENDQL